MPITSIEPLNATQRERRGLAAAEALGIGPGRDPRGRPSNTRLHTALEKHDSPEEVLSAVGRLMAVLHGASSPIPDPATIETPPWTPLTLAQWHGSPPAQRRFVGLLHRDGELCAVAREAVATLTGGRSWCHGDLRLENILLVRSDVPVLIDWEFSGRARPAVDFGALGGSILQHALSSQCSRATGSLAMEELRRSWARTQRSLAAVVDSYVATGGESPPSFELAVAWGNATLTRGMVRATYVGFDRVSAALLHIGRTLFTRPEGWTP